jgi:hypothetical protein
MSQSPSAAEVAQRVYAAEASNATTAERATVDEAVAAVTRVSDALERAMSNLVGTMGFRAMFARCVRKVKPRFECLRDAMVDDRAPVLAPLAACLKTAEPAVILEIGRSLLAAFFELSATLVGEELTVRLFSDTWPEAFSHTRDAAENS